MRPAVLGSQRRLRETHAMSSLRVSRLREKFETPRVAVRIERQRLERNLVLGRPAALELGRGCIPDAVPIAVVLGDVAIQAVEPHAVRVQAEEIAAAARVERVERHEQRVFLSDRRALAHDVRGEPARRREHPRGDVQRVVVVEQVDLGALRRLGVLDGIDLMKIVDARRIRPRGVVEHAVDRRPRGRARDLHGLLARDRAARRPRLGLWPRFATRRRRSRPQQPAP